MTTQKRDVCLTLIAASSSNQVQIDSHWFECPGPVTKAEIDRGISEWRKAKQKEGKTIVGGVSIYNVFVAEPELKG